MKGLFSLYVLSAALLFASCEKEDKAVPLPQRGEAEYGNVEMGEDYTDQIFFDLETGRVVHMSEINSWHLAFEASVNGYHMFLNGGADVMICKTGESNFSKVKSAPANTSKDWMFDRPCGLADSTAMGDWRTTGGLSKNEVYLVKLNPTYEPDNLKKIKLVYVSSTEYVLEYADINESISHTISIPKDEKYNYSYFSFSGGGKVLQPDPPKDTWDIVFTRYRYIYYALDNLPYMVNGVLLNPHNTMAAEDTSTSFADLDFSKVLNIPLSNHRDVIGFDWKTYSFDTERYEINKEKNFVIKTRKGQYYKMRFLDFYNKQGIKGSPSFEFQRVY